jgi:2-keto-3-deoxy-L-rhamnonate aldolase RhmA
LRPPGATVPSTPPSPRSRCPSTARSAVGAEICGRAGLDWVVVDLEHGVGDESGLVPVLLATRSTGTAALVRVEQGTRLRVGRVLDLGADGIVVPQVQTAAEARDITSWMRFPPAGRRGVALFTRGLDFGAGGHPVAAWRHETITGIVQIETGQAVEAAEEMAAVDGVDVLFVGPADLSYSLGVPGDIHAEAFDTAIRRVAAAARSHGKAAGVMVWRPDDIARYADAGYTVFSLSGDGPVLADAVGSLLRSARAITGG